MYGEGISYISELLDLCVDANIVKKAGVTTGAFYGYYAKGNSLEVGRASTKAVVVSSVVILMMDLIITQISYL